MKKKLTIAFSIGIVIFLGAASATSLSISKIIRTLGEAQELTGLTSETLERYGINAGDLEALNQIIGEAETIVTDANNYYNQFSQFYGAIVDGNVRGVLSKAQDLAGVLGIPDPDAMHNATNRDRSSVSDRALGIGNNAYLDSFFTESIALSTLSKQGQQRLIEQQQQSILIGGAIAAAADGINSKNRTQDVMKVIAQNQSHLGEIAVSQSNQLTNLQVNTAATNYSLAKVNKLLATNEARVAKERELQKAQLLYSGTSIYIPGFRSEEISNNP